MPIHDFLDKLDKNAKDAVREVALGKDIQQELLELKGKK